MPEQTSARGSRITGGDLLSEILRNMEEGLFKIRYTALAPSIYRVYLHPEEFEPLRGAMQVLTAEVKRALDERLAAWNGERKAPGFLRKLGGATQQEVEYKKLTDDWTVEFYPDVDGSLQKGEIEIHSELGAPPKTDYGAGALTRRIFKSPGGEHQTVSTQRQEPDGPVLAELRYQDGTGPRVYAMSKDQIAIGRGGKAYWVDVRLDAPSDISREHCRIRRDAATGQFFLKDLSQFGTTVNGNAIPRSLATVDGEEKDANIESPLPKKARIGLADMLFLDFEAKDPA
jgi:hypothetical protein